MADFGVMLAAKFEHSKDNHVRETGAIHRALSSFSFPVKRPFLSANGSRPFHGVLEV